MNKGKTVHTTPTPSTPKDIYIYIHYEKKKQHTSQRRNSRKSNDIIPGHCLTTLGTSTTLQAPDAPRTCQDPCLQALDASGGLVPAILRDATSDKFSGGSHGFAQDTCALLGRRVAARGGRHEAWDVSGWRGRGSGRGWTRGVGVHGRRAHLLGDLNGEPQGCLLQRERGGAATAAATVAVRGCGGGTGRCVGGPGGEGRRERCDEVWRSRAGVCVHGRVCRGRNKFDG